MAKKKKGNNKKKKVTTASTNGNASNNNNKPSTEDNEKQQEEVQQQEDATNTMPAVEDNVVVNATESQDITSENIVQQEENVENEVPKAISSSEAEQANDMNRQNEETQSKEDVVAESVPNKMEKEDVPQEDKPEIKSSGDEPQIEEKSSDSVIADVGDIDLTVSQKSTPDEQKSIQQTDALEKEDNMKEEDEQVTATQSEEKTQPPSDLEVSSNTEQVPEQEPTVKDGTEASTAKTKASAEKFDLDETEKMSNSTRERTIDIDNSPSDEIKTETTHENVTNTDGKSLSESSHVDEMKLEDEATNPQTCEDNSKEADLINAEETKELPSNKASSPHSHDEPKLGNEEQGMNLANLDKTAQAIGLSTSLTEDNMPAADKSVETAENNDTVSVDNAFIEEKKSDLSPPSERRQITTANTGDEGIAESSSIIPFDEVKEPTSSLREQKVVVPGAIDSVSIATHEQETNLSEHPPPKSSPSGVSFAQAFASPTSTSQVEKKPSIETESKDIEQAARVTPRGMTFSQAFGKDPATPVSPLATPISVAATPGTPEMPTNIEPQLSTKSGSSSHSALSAAKNKKVAGLMSKYMEEVSHESLPGDAVPIRRRSPQPSPTASYVSQGTPLSAQSVREKVAVTEVELAQLPNIGSVREKFELSSRSSGSNSGFEYGESFRQKQRYEQLSDREKELEAKVAMRGFNERDLFPNRNASGEVDTSSLGKTYTFEMSTDASLAMPDGQCRVDYRKANFRAMVFVVHRTRGMLLLHVNVPADSSKDPAKKIKKSRVPGGSVSEDEFLRAAKQSGSTQVQLQIAAREAAARQLYEKTGLDIRNAVDRFKPAVLRLNPPVDARGVQYLKNEYDNKLYYFLQVDESDFVSQTCADPNVKLTRPSEDPGDSPLTLRLSSDYSGFTFVQDPADAAKVLHLDGNQDATLALNMIMNEATGEIAAKLPDAKATEYSVSESVPEDERRGTLANVKTVGEKQEEKPKADDGKRIFHDEADLKLKSSSDTHEHVTDVKCCCGWW